MGSSEKSGGKCGGTIYQHLTATCVRVGKSDILILYGRNFDLNSLS